VHLLDDAGEDKKGAPRDFILPHALFAAARRAGVVPRLPEGAPSRYNSSERI